MKALAGKGHATTLVGTISRSYFKTNDPRINLVSVPIRRVPLISNVFYTIFLLFFLPIHILLVKPDIIIMDPTISVLGSIPGILFSRFSRTKFILDIKSTPVEVKGLKDKLAVFFFNISVLVAKMTFHGIAIVTPMMKEEVCRKFDIDQRKVGVWTNGVPVHLFDPGSSLAESTRLRRELGLANKFVVFYHGVFSASRGLTETVEAIQIIRQKYPEVALFLLGTGSIVSSLEDLIRQKSLQNNVILHDPVPYEDVPKFVGVGDVCIVPCLNSPYWNLQSPLKLMEYLAMEKVVLASDLPCNRTVIGDKKCCIYLRSSDPSEIAKSIEYAYTNVTRLGDWGKIGRMIVKDHYTWDKVAAEVEQFLFRKMRFG